MNFLEALKSTGLQKVRFLLKNKYESELDFQREWVKAFDANLAKVRGYWFNHRFLAELLDVCCIRASDRVLDVGCGLASVLNFVGDCQKFAVDPLADEYLKLHSFGDINLKRAYGEYLLFPSEYFDVVFCSNALDHTSEPRQVVSEIYRVLKSDGYAVIVVEIFGKKFRRDPGHPHVFTVSDVLELTSAFSIVFQKTATWDVDDVYPKTVDVKRTDLILLLQK